jgi:dTDP-4-amino-4,6-dideoxygalactose transaminase
VSAEATAKLKSYAVIPYLDLKAQYRALKSEIDAAVLRVLESGEYALGAEVAKFEEEFAAYCGARYGIGVNSGTSALHLALLAAGVGPGDEVITVPYTFVATTAAIRYTGATPVFVDIDPLTYMIDVRGIEERITPRTKAILPVHLYGQSCDMDPILEIAKRHKLVVIEDAAQAHGAGYKGRRVGTLGHMAIFSFYPTKNLGTCGEGGIVTTDNAEFARQIRMLRNWGMEQRYYHMKQGFNYRMEAIQAAILRVKLECLEEWIEARRANAAIYNELLKGSGVMTPHVEKDRRHVYNVYAIRSPRRQALTGFLQAREIQYGIYYPEPIHLMRAHADLGHKTGDFPIAETVSEQILALPLYPELKREQIEEICAAVREAHMA